MASVLVSPWLKDVKWRGMDKNTPVQSAKVKGIDMMNLLILALSSKSYNCLILKCTICVSCSGSHLLLSSPHCVVPENIHPFLPWGEGIFTYDLPPLGIFQNRFTKWIPPSPPEVPFLLHTPWEYYHSLWKPKISYLFRARYKNLILTVFFFFFFFFPKIWWIL